MAKNITTPVKGGWIKRDATSGQFREIGKANGQTSKASASTSKVVKEVSNRRSEALKRLADR